ncbi:MAG: MurR/RpiR family transcriptional regulator [Actinomycetota bacterium]|nr:MurR/RpiR family transcriptional regulator [Actinomycetota bacterium]
MSDRELIERIHNTYDSMTGSERRLADLILGSPSRLYGLTATEIAEQAEVSKATVSRFVTKLGLADYNEFRLLAKRANAELPGSPLHLLANQLQATNGDLGALIDQTLAWDTNNLRSTYGYLDIGLVDRVAGLFADAPRLTFADFRKQYALAYYAGTLFNSIRPRVAILPVPGTSVVDHAAQLDADDTVVMFPMRRPQVEHDRLSGAVVDAGGTLVTIGDEYPNPASQRATVHLVCHTKGVGVFDSQVAPMSVINLLFTATTNRLGDAATDRLAALERGHERHHTFLD